MGIRLSARLGRLGAATVTVVATSTLVQLSAPVIAAADGPSVGLPSTPSVSVTAQTMASRPPDQASSNALSGNQSGGGSTPDGAGTSTATSLAPSATWDVSEHTGDFSWSYPLRMPPAPGGLQPNLALSYRSSAVDGRTSATNNQPSWVGDGWDLSPGFVERTYGACVDDTEGGTTPPQTGDLCWRTDNATASYGGGGGMLIRDDSNGVWRPKNDDGSRIERDTGAGNGDNNGEYWKITTVDGTQYFFGSQPASGSTWTAPVFGDDNSEPCHGATFETSQCVQAWRWNLDKVVDRHGNMVRYFYDTEANSYGLNRRDTAVSYTRGGTLRRIEYGLRDDDPNLTASARVEFSTADRCVPGSVCTLDNKPNWPDTPLDDRCDTPTCSDRYSPTFWSTKRLASITTQVWRGSGYTDVDRWTLDQQYPDPGDGEKAALWLKSITHTGLVGGSMTLPAVTFEGGKLPNRVFRVDGIAPLNRYRITGIVSESGGWTSVVYAPPECADGGTMPANPETNTLRCFPVRWAKRDHAERTDYFHKHVVAQVVQSDRLSTSTQQVTSYEYLDGAAWHFDMSEFVKDDKKTWNEFRGFKRVRVRQGTPNDPAGPVTMSEQRFYRGMDGDRLPSGTRPAEVSDSEGGARTDSDWLQGFGFESATFEREAPSSQPDPPRLTKTITEPSWQGPTATRGAFNAYIVRPGVQRAFTALRSGGWRVTKAGTTYDDRGLPVTVDDLGDVADASDDRCTRTSYVRNTGKWLLSFPSRIETVAVNCAATPTFPDHAIADSRLSYDGLDAGAEPVAGDITRVEVADTRPATGPNYVTTSTARFDRHGRGVESADALGNATKAAFTPAVGGPVTKVTVTSAPTAAVPAGLVTTTTLEPAFGQQTMVVDPNGSKTETTYDALGRKTEVWLPNRERTRNPRGNLQFAYVVRNDAPTVVTTTKIGPTGNYTSSNTLLDGLMRARQVQTPAVDGGRLLIDTRYDSQGRAFKSTQPYFNDAAVDTTLWVASDTEVPGLTRTEFDGAGRPTASVYQAGAFEKWRSTTRYDGDRVHVTPPSGGTATTTINNARGQTVELRQYLAPTPEGAYDATTYAYTPAEQLASVTDPAGNVWRYFYDLRGRKIRTVDPDRGTTELTYDNRDLLESTRDARGVKLTHSYDQLGRKTATREGSTTGPKLAEWTYDTVAFSKGHLATSTRFVNGNAYTVKVGNYNSMYKPTSVWVTVPAAEGALAGTYKTFFGYDWDGSLSGMGYASGGGLAAEDVDYVYDDLGLMRSSSGTHNGTVELASESNYTRYGELQRLQLGDGTKRAWLSYYYDTNTRRLNRHIVDAEAPRPMQADINYTYDPAGNVTSIADKPLEQTPDVQCFRYDHQRRLTEAWTPALPTWSETTGCQQAPAVAGLSGPAPYWLSYGYDKVGNRLSETQHASTGDTQRTYEYPAVGGAQPHALRSVTTTRPGQPAVTDSFGYDQAGNTTSRTLAVAGETLSWDAEGHLSSVTRNGQITSYIYTADGQRLLRKDPTGTTLYLEGQELRLATGATTPVCTRYYTFAGRTIAVRQGASLTWLTSDHQGSSQLAIASDTLQTTRRRQAPFGAPRGTSPNSWPGEKGFVGGTTDPTGLTHLGAREYDPTLGRFLSVDPIMDLADPQQMHGYAYSNNNPTTYSDPSGLKHFEGDGPGWQNSSPTPGGSGAGTPAPSVGNGPAPVTIVGYGNGGIAEAGGQARDLGVLAKRNGYKTHYSIIDIMVEIPVAGGGDGPRSIMPGVIIGLTFTPMPHCGDPVNTGVAASADNLTRDERAAYKAAHPPEVERPVVTARDVLTALTGVGAVVDCFSNPSFSGCATAAAAIAPIPVGKGIAAGVRAADNIPSIVYRGGSPSPSNLKLRPGESALSFRDSLSNPLPPGVPVLHPGKPYIGIDTSKLPPGSIVPDGVPGSTATPPGHVSVYVDDWELLQNAVIDRGKFPK